MSIANLVRSEHLGHRHVVMQPDGMVRMERGLQEPFATMDEVLIRGITAQHHLSHRHHIGGNFSRYEPEIFNATQGVEADIIQLWDAPRTEWVLLFGVVFTLMCIDATFSRRLPEGCYKTDLAVLAVWVLCGLSYNVLYFILHGADDGMDWFAGYALEWMLSVDNLFAFQLILRSYRANVAIQQKALFYGVLGSIVTRCVLFCTISSIVQSIQFAQFVLGIMLIYGGIKSLEEDDGQDVCDFFFVRMLKRCLGSRLQDSYDLENHRLFVWDEDGRLCATLLVPLIGCVIIADVIFAVDSVSAKVAQIPNQYIAYSSSVLALLGLRAMFFVLDDLVESFEMLKYGVCFILIFIGIELMFASRIHFPVWFVLLVIVTVFNFCIVASLIKRTFYSTQDEGEAPQKGKEAVEKALESLDARGANIKTSDSSSAKYQRKPHVTEELQRKLQTRLEACEGSPTPRRYRSPNTPRLSQKAAAAEAAASQADTADSAAG